MTLWQSNADDILHLARSFSVDVGSLTGGISAMIPAPRATASWFPEAASTHAGGVDGPFFILYLAAAFVVVLVAGLTMTYVLQFKRGDEHGKGAPAGRPNPLFLGLWLLGAGALGLYAFTSGLPGLLDQSVAPYGAYAVDVTARQWGYDFTYPNGHVADTLHVATGQPVRLTMRSEDVIHGLSVPALRVSEAILPDRDSDAWFEATVADTFELRSNIFSGEGYGDMRTAVVALSPAGFEAWMQKVSDIFANRTMAEVGELLYSIKGCKACHSLDGSKLVGPSFKELYGHEFDTREGVRITVDDAYVRESILTPNVSVIAGFEPVMTPYAGQITDKEIEAVTAWLMTMSSLGGAPVEDGDAAADTTGTPAGQEETE